jgi:hypothetical protein
MQKSSMMGDRTVGLGSFKANEDWSLCRRD